MSDRSSSRAGTPSSASSHAQAISPRNRTLSNTSIGGESSVGQASGTVAAEVAVTVGDGQMPVDGDGDGHTAQVQVVNGGHGGHESACNEVEDMDRLLKKLDMEKKMIALQQRLELASMKVTNGWEDRSINEIETHKLTPKSARRNPNLSIAVGGSPQIPYEPPSPSRPWQLIDVLWQPLPPPSGANLPSSPTSPRKRSRAEYSHQHQHHSNPPSPNFGLPHGVHRRASSSSHNPMAFLQHDPHASPYPSSPLRNESLHGLNTYEKKRRSQSHSHAHPRIATTTQDVDAAKALTSMLGSGSSDPRHGSRSQSPSTLGPNGMGAHRRPVSLQAPLLPPMGSHSLPIPESYSSSSSTRFEHGADHHSHSSQFRPRASSDSFHSHSPEKDASSPYPYPQPYPATTDSHSRQAAQDLLHAREALAPAASLDRAVESRRGSNGYGHGHGQRIGGAHNFEENDDTKPETSPDADDESAAELMMFLAHSPSPMKRVSESRQSASLGGAARVLFADPEKDKDKDTDEGERGGKVVGNGTGNGTGTALDQAHGQVFGLGIGRESRVKSGHHSNLALAPPIMGD